MAGRISTGSRADLAVTTPPTGRTGATVTGAVVLPRGGRVRGRFRDIEGARLARGVPVGGLHGAGAAVQARFRVTVPKLRLAVGTGEAWRARAGVRALAGVEAGAAVPAGLVIRAEVQVLVAEQTAPALVA